MSRRTNIYGLYDPREFVDGEIENIRYVGKTNNPERRLYRHIRDSRNGSELPIHRWIGKLLRAGATPGMMILSEPPVDSYEGTEQHVIDVMRDEGHDLLNVAEGGEGLTSEQMKQIANRCWSNPEIRAKHSAAMTRYWSNPEIRAKQSAVHKLFWDKAARAKQSIVTSAGLKSWWATRRIRRLRIKIRYSMMLRYREN